MVTIFGLIIIYFPYMTLVCRPISWFEWCRPHVYHHTLLTEVIANSSFLAASHLSSVIISIPLLLDVLLDLCFSRYHELHKIQERLFYLISMNVPSAIFLYFRSSIYMTSLYVAMNGSRRLLVGYFVYSAVMPQFKLRSPVYLPLALRITFFFWVASSFGTAMGATHNLPLDIQFTATMLSAVGLFGFFISGLFWAWKVNQKLQNESPFGISSRFSDDDCVCFVYLVALLLYAGPIQLWNLVHLELTWTNRGESSLLFVVFALIAFTIVITVLPGRIMRRNIQLRDETLAIKRSLTRYLSHEIRSPLSIVHAGLDLLVSDLRSEVLTAPTRLVELIDDVFSASESALSILDDLLQYENIEAGKLKVDLKWTPMKKMWDGNLKWVSLLTHRNRLNLNICDHTADVKIHDCLEVVDVDSDVEDLEGGKKNDSVESIYRLDELYLKIDRYKLEQVLRNLVTNAIKHTPLGGLLKIDISHSIETVQWRDVDMDGTPVGTLRVEVIDNGAGIALEDRDRVFGELMQFNSDELRGGGGTGLGLWISRHIIHLHNGSIGFTSNGLGCGSTFFFELPLFTANKSGVPIPSLLMPDVRPHSSASTFNNSPKLHSTVKQRPTVTTNNSETNNTLDEQIQRSSNKPHGIKRNSISLIPLTSHHDAMNEFHTQEQVGDVENGLNDIRTLSNFHFDVFEHDLGGDKTGISMISCEYGYGKESNPINPGFVRPARLQQQKSFKSSGRLNPSTSIFPEISLFQVPIRFLIVDDSYLNRKMLVRLIERDHSGKLMNADIMEADDGITALELLRSEMINGRTFDFILMDFVMIKMNGPDAASIMRKELKYDGIIIGVTGNALPDDIDRFITCGANEVLLKPLTKARLFISLYSYL